MHKINFNFIDTYKRKDGLIDGGLRKFTKKKKTIVFYNNCEFK